MPFSNNDSTFDCTGFSGENFTLSINIDSSSSSGLFPSVVADRTNPERIETKNTAGLKEAEDPVFGADQKLTILKACVRHDIMEQISDVVSELVSIGTRYSDLSQANEVDSMHDNNTGTSDCAREDASGIKTDLESLHAYTIAELHVQLRPLKKLVSDIDVAYSQFAKRMQGKVEELERFNSELICEVERLRRLY